jgi:hypothetical protein
MAAETTNGGPKWKKYFIRIKEPDRVPLRLKSRGACRSLLQFFFHFRFRRVLLRSNRYGYIRDRGVSVEILNGDPYGNC